MAAYDPNDPAVYGPIPGVGLVTLSQWNAYNTQLFAANQQAAHDQFAAVAQSFPVDVANPYVVPPKVTAPPPAGTSTAAAGAAEKSHLIGAGGGLSDYCLYFPDDPLCEFFGGGFGGGGGGGGEINETIVFQGLDATDVNAAIDNGLTAVWSAVVGSIDSVLAAAIASIQGALTGIGNAIKAAYAVLSRLGGFILGFLQTLLRDIVAGILHVLQDMRDLFKHVIDDVLKPLAGALQAIRDKLLDLYKRFVRPVLLILHQFRQLLNILALFHVPFARKLDQKLADLERRVTQPLLLLLSYTNAVANWINLLSTVNYLIQSPTWLWSFKAYIGPSTNLQLAAMTPNVDQAAIAAIQAANSAPTVQQSQAAGVTYIQTGGGDHAVIAQQMTDMLTADLSQGFF